ncbi:MAG: hypothetical protein MR678_02110 [Muribaculaceae bacterium]|jgi:hypothetical protein|nr:hypothetical protein [Muribaculaceae bacterium]
MSKLEMLYQTLQNMRDLGLEIDNDLLMQTSKLEEKLIKEEVLPRSLPTLHPSLQRVANLQNDCRVAARCA